MFLGDVITMGGTELAVGITDLDVNNADKDLE